MTDNRVLQLKEARSRMPINSQDIAFADCLLAHIELQNPVNKRAWFWIDELARRYPPPQVEHLGAQLEKL